MEITDVRVKLVRRGEERLKASCTVTLDGEFVIRDVKVIEGSNGLFVAMPSRKVSDHCPRCSHKNHLRARYCNHCGAEFNHDRMVRNGPRPTQLHVEIAHPINSECRDRLQERVLTAYEEECSTAGEDQVRREPPDRAASPERSPQVVKDRPDEADPDWSVPADADPMGDYKSLVDDLKSEAQQRRGDDPVRQPVRSSQPAAAHSESTGFDAHNEVAVDDREDEDSESQRQPSADDDDFSAGLV